MPPKAKFSREDITDAALAIARAEGIHAITARTLGARLHSSARPIFTVFQNMEEVHQETIKRARQLYNQYVEEGLSCQPAFKGVGKQYIAFARREPKLFQLLFMSELQNVPDSFHVLETIDENHPQILASIVDAYHVSTNTAQALYHHLWIYCHGIATLCATNVCRIADGEIEEWLTDVFVSLLQRYKREVEQ